MAEMFPVYRIAQMIVAHGEDCAEVRAALRDATAADVERIARNVRQMREAAADPFAGL